MVSFFRFFEVAAALVKVGGTVILTKGTFGAIVYGGTAYKYCIFY